MPKYIVEIRNPYDDTDRRLIEWSAVVDAPISHGMRPREFVEYYLGQYGERTADELLVSLRRVRDTGTSDPSAESWLETIHPNRAGDDESEAGMAEIWRMCVPHSPRGTGASRAVQDVRGFAAAWEAEQ